MPNEYPRGVEVVASTLITNDQGQVLLIRSPKWGDVWLIPGGHIEPNETAVEAAKREGEEETGLNLKMEYLVNVGELINDPAFHRKSHLIYFHFVSKAVTQKFKTDPREVSEVKWFDPKDALGFPLAEGIQETLQHYIEGVKVQMVSKRFM